MNFDFSKPFILDGATGTELQKLGCERGVCPEVWVLEHPEALTQVQKAYAEAGCDCVYAATFGANAVTLAGHSVEIPVADICSDLVAISRNAVPKSVLVGGDMAPCGLSLAPYGNASFDDFIKVFTAQAQGLEDAGVDFFVIETQMSIAEAKASILAVRSVSDKPIFVSFAVNNSGRSFMGADVVSALVILQELDITAFGINCCSDMDMLNTLVAQMYPFAKVPLIVKPNAGMPDTSTGETVYHMTAEEFAKASVGFVERGAALLGGCCGTNAGHMKAMATAVADMKTLPVDAKFTSVAATSTRYHCVTEDSVIIEKPIDDDLQEHMEDAIDEGADLLHLSVSCEQDIDVIDEYQHCLSLPLSVSFENNLLRDSFQKRYHGKANIK